MVSKKPTKVLNRWNNIAVVELTTSKKGVVLSIWTQTSAKSQSKVDVYHWDPRRTFDEDKEINLSNFSGRFQESNDGLTSWFWAGQKKISVTEYKNKFVISSVVEDF